MDGHESCALASRLTGLIQNASGNGGVGEREKVIGMYASSPSPHSPAMETNKLVGLAQGRRRAWSSNGK